MSSKRVMVAAASSLLLAMALHAVIHHDHPHFAFGEGVTAAMHAEERKHWAAELAIGLLFVGFAAGLAAAPARPADVVWTQADGICHDPFRRILRRGLLHRKHCE